MLVVKFGKKFFKLIFSIKFVLICGVVLFKIDWCFLNLIEKGDDDSLFKMLCRIYFCKVLSFWEGW